MLQKQASASTVYARQAVASGATNAILNTVNIFEKNGIMLPTSSFYIIKSIIF